MGAIAVLPFESCHIDGAGVGPHKSGMKMKPEPIVGYAVFATRNEPGSKLRVREFLVGITDRDEAAGAVISAYPELDDGFHVEAGLGITRDNAMKLGLSDGEVRPGAESEL